MNLFNRILKKSTLWHLGAILLFVIISCVYFAPALKGYQVKQGDIVNYIGSSREIADYRDNFDEQTLWTNSMFSGMPSTQISMRYEGTWFTRGVSKIVGLGLPRPILFLFVYFISFYILALSLKLKPLIGIVGSIAFGLSSYFIVIIEAGHNSKAAAIGLAPLMIAGFIMAYRFKNWILGVALAGAFMAVQLAANHVQITYYMAFVLLLLGVAELVRHMREGQVAKFAKVTGGILAVYVLAVMVNYGNLFGTVEYSKQTIRGGTELTINANGESNANIKTAGLDREYVTNWSYGTSETFTLAIPNFKGGETQAIGQNEANEPILDDVDSQYKASVAQSNQYWGDQPFTSGPVYIGIIVLFLAMLGMVYIKDKYKWALLSVTLLTIMLSWGKNYVSAFVLFPILLYNVCMFLEDKKKRLIVAGVTTVLLLFAMGKGDIFMERSLTDFFLDVVPGYNKLRAVTIILVVAELCVPLLAVLFLERLIRKREEILKDMTGFYIVSGVFFLFLVINLVAPGTFNSFLSGQENALLDGIQDPALYGQYTTIFGALEDARMAIFKKDVLRSLGFFVVGAALVFGFIRTGYSKFILAGGLALFILLDLFSIDKRYLNNDGRGKNYNQWVEAYKMQYPFTAGEGEQQILTMETLANPEIAIKIDEGLKALEQEFKEDEDISAREKQVTRDFLTYRILNRHSNFRVFEEGNPFNSSYTSYFNKSIGGYHGAKLSRYQDLIEFHLSKQNPAVIDMLNTKYYLRPERDNTGAISNTKLTRINETAMGNAWLSKGITVVANADEEILALDAYNATTITNKGLGQVLVDGENIQNAALKGTEAVSILLPGMTQPSPIDNMPLQAAAEQPLALIADSTGALNWVYDSAPDSLFNKIFSISSNGRGGWDPKETTVVDQRFKSNLTADSYSGQGTIEMTNYHPDKISYAFNSSDKQFAVFSEVYYDGWKASIDGSEVPVSRVNYVLRGIEIPAGEHEVVFEYTSETYEKSGMLANIGSLIIILILIYGLFIESKAIPEVEEELNQETNAD